MTEASMRFVKSSSKYSLYFDLPYVTSEFDYNSDMTNLQAGLIFELSCCNTCNDKDVAFFKHMSLCVEITTLT